jgi:hypothetical protein
MTPAVPATRTDAMPVARRWSGTGPALPLAGLCAGRHPRAGPAPPTKLECLFKRR